jgi:hypothetical protein
MSKLLGIVLASLFATGVMAQTSTSGSASGSTSTNTNANTATSANTNTNNNTNTNTNNVNVYGPGSNKLARQQAGTTTAKTTTPSTKTAQLSTPSGRKACPPGLVKKNNGCRPPGLAKRSTTATMGASRSTTTLPKHETDATRSTRPSGG